MTDYRKLPLGSSAPDRIGAIVKCPNCGEHVLMVEDYKQSIPGSREKETVYIHSDTVAARQITKDGRTFEEFEAKTVACRDKIKPVSPHGTSLVPPEENPRE